MRWLHKREKKGTPEVLPFPARRRVACWCDDGRRSRSCAGILGNYGDRSGENLSSCAVPLCSCHRFDLDVKCKELLSRRPAPKKIGKRIFIAEASRENSQQGLHRLVSRRRQQPARTLITGFTLTHDRLVQAIMSLGASDHVCKRSCVLDHVSR